MLRYHELAVYEGDFHLNDLRNVYLVVVCSTI